jgi:cytochrome c oxidase subunit 1
MALTETRPDTDTGSAGDASQSTTGSVERLLGSADHVAIGRLFIGFGLALATLSLTLWAITGVDALTDNGFLGSRPAQLVASAQTALLFLGVVPVLLGIAIAVVPLQLGSPSIAFPRAAALSFWTWLVAAGIFVTSVAIDGGVLGADTTAAKLGNVSLGAVLVALGLGAVCVATTVMVHRPLGMRLAWVPGLSWASLLAAVLWLATLGALFAHVVLGQVGRMGAGALSTNFLEGMTWVFRGPAVFVFAIPVLGIAVDVVVGATGRRFANTDVLQLIIGLYAVLAFGAWAQRPSALNTAMWTLFALAITVPVLGMLGALADSLRRGTVTVTPALILSVVAVLLIMGAVLTGWVQALSLAGEGTLFGASSGTLAAAQTAFVAAAALAGGIAGSLHWSPLLWGGPGTSTEGRLTVPLVVLGGGLLGTALLVQAIVQLDGEPTAHQLFGALTAAGAALLALGVLSGLIAAVRAADDDAGTPEGATLEWSFPSPASGGVGLEDLARVTSPYPLLDAREGTEEKD